MSNLRVLSNKQTLPWVSWLRWQPGDLQPIWGGKKQNKKLRIKPPTSFPPSVTDWGKLDGDRQRMSHRHSPYLSSCERLLKNGIERGSVKTQLTAWVPAKPTPNFSPLHHISSNTTIMNTNLQTLEQWSAILNIQYMCVCAGAWSTLTMELHSARPPTHTLSLCVMQYEVWSAARWNVVSQLNVICLFYSQKHFVNS